MKYIKVIWVHNSPSYPLVLFYEVNKEREIVRVTEIFPDGSLSYATEHQEYKTGISNDIPFPDIKEIASEEELYPFLISKDQFEVVWEKAKADKI